MRAWVLGPRTAHPQGALFVIPGLHFLGPEDPRMLRFLTALAASGIEVFAPFLPTPLALRLDERAAEEAACALETALARQSGRRLGIFTISFGSTLGVRLKADERFADRVGDVMLFGGFCDWKDALRYSVTDRDMSDELVPPDPLNQAVIYMNLVEAMDVAFEEAEALRRAWRSFVGETWGEPDMRTPRRYVPIAERLASELSESLRPRFLRGCSVNPGGLEEVESALSQRETCLSWLDPRPHLAHLKGTIHVAHGADDDVVPVRHADQLVDACPSSLDVHRWVTGLYGHTQHSGLRGLADRGPAALRELRTMLGLLSAIASVSNPRSL